MMKRPKLPRMVYVAALVVLGTVFLPVAYSGQSLTVTGTVSGFSIYGEDGAVYDMADTDKAARLTGLQSARVTVTGTLKEDPVLGKVLDVTAFKVLSQKPVSQDKNAPETTQSLPSPQEIQPRHSQEGMPSAAEPPASSGS